MHGLECLDFQLMLATCLEVLRTSCYSIKKLPLLLGLAHHIVKPNTYLGRAKVRWMQSLASESLLRASRAEGSTSAPPLLQKSCLLLVWLPRATSECACAI